MRCQVKAFIFLPVMWCFRTGRSWIVVLIDVIESPVMPPLKSPFAGFFGSGVILTAEPNE